MIQFKRRYKHKEKVFVYGTKATLIPELEEELISKNIAVRVDRNSQFVKLKTEFFKPKEDGKDNITH